MKIEELDRKILKVLNRDAMSSKEENGFRFLFLNLKGDYHINLIVIFAVPSPWQHAVGIPYIFPAGCKDRPEQKMR
jgi:hypothetical protein